MTDETHLKSSIQVYHLLGVLPLGYTHHLLHLLSLSLHILAHRYEPVDSSLKVFDERLGVECY